MKPFLLASATALAFASTACAVTAADDETIHYVGNDDHQSIHINTSGNDSVIIVDGQRIEVRDGAVFIDGERHEARDGQVIIADGTTIRVGDGDHHFSWSGDFEFDGEHRERVEAEIARAMAMVGNVDHEAMREAHEEARRAIEEAMARLDIDDVDGGRWVIENGERRELTDEERAEVREAIREAREEMRDAMRDQRDAMRDARDVARGEARRHRVEVVRMARDSERHAERAARHAERAQALRERIHESGANSVRFESENGEQRVWVDDRELEGDERTEWLNRMQLDELEGGPGEHSYFFSDDNDSDEHGVFFFDEDDSDERRVTIVRSDGDDADTTVRARRIVIEIDSDDDEGVEVYEFSSDDEN